MRSVKMVLPGRFEKKIHVLNPKQVQNFKKAYSDLPKNDEVDAFVIADHLRFGRAGNEVYMDDYRYRAPVNAYENVAAFEVVQNLTRERTDLQTISSKCSGIA